MRRVVLFLGIASWMAALSRQQESLNTASFTTSTELSKT
jgi:hypothetical protein